MLQHNLRVFVWSHLFLATLIFLIYTHKTYLPILLVISCAFLLWSLVLIYFSYTSQLREWLKNDRILNLIIFIDVLFITAVHLLPNYTGYPPIWLLLFLVPFYAQELGSKAAFKISVLGLISLVLTIQLKEPNYMLTIAVILEMVIFIIFVGKKTDKLNYLAFYDVLTGLTNRTYMRKTLDFYLKSAEGPVSNHFYLFLMDLDRFKEVNDTYGHDTGDRLLQIVAERIQGVVPKHAIVSRIGGDEFTVLLPVISKKDESETLAGQLVACLDQPIHIDEKTLNVSMSLGIANFPQDGKHATTLLKMADTAMYNAKRTGRNRYAYSTE